MIFMFLQCVSTVIIVFIIISPLNSYLYIHWILDLKYILLFIIIIKYMDISQLLLLIYLILCGWLIDIFQRPQNP